MEIFLLLLVLPLTGVAVAFLLTRRPELSGRLALTLASLPYLGFGLALKWC